jgi:hypothetical protein
MIDRENFIKRVRIKKIKQKYKQIANKKAQIIEIKKNYKEDSNKNLQTNKIIRNYYKLMDERVIYRILNSLHNRIYCELKRLNIKRTFMYRDVLGCSINKFESHLLNLMKEGMSFDNYGEWEVDHIVPFSYFDFTNFDEIHMCCNYKNLQPLWKPENREKGAKLIYSPTITSEASSSFSS